VDLDRLLSGVTRPARYTGGEWNAIVKDWDSAVLRVALAYPDVYDVGMCNLGLAIIYDLLNGLPGVLADRVFSPWADMEKRLRDEGVPLFGLESRRALSEFDVVGFSLGYELTYTNALNMLDLAGIPLLASERGEEHPLVIAGGSCALNPEPMADFVDLFVLGEGEEVIPALVDLLQRRKGDGMLGKRDLMREAARIPGVYVPSLYRVEYNDDGTVSSVSPIEDGVPLVVNRRLVDALPPAVTRPIVPFMEVVHDRGAVEIQRGCSKGCRFCQAGMVYRPVRERPKDEVIRAVDEIVANCGYEEVSLLSLSTSDYSQITDVVSALSRKYRGRHLTLSLPSLRLDSFSVGLANSLQEGKKTGFTFAPEAGTERLRTVINKNVGEDEILRAVETAWERGWKNIKLYFMLGLPTETLADVEGIVQLVRRIRGIGKGRLNIRVNLSTFVPKAHTPFQWCAQESEDELSAKIQVVRSGLKKAGVPVSWHDPKVSVLEGALSRGDRRVGRAILGAWRQGCRFDAWSEEFNWSKWEEAFTEAGFDPLFYAAKERSIDEVLPWGHIDAGVEPSFLRDEYRRATMQEETLDCQLGPCNRCGMQRVSETCRARCADPDSVGSAG